MEKILPELEGAVALNYHYWNNICS